jgi:hypothetical protein
LCTRRDRENAPEPRRSGYRGANCELGPRDTNESVEPARVPKEPY